MMLYCKNGIRVLQHEYLNIFYIQTWMECDNPRSYGRHYDYATVHVSRSIEDANTVVLSMLKAKNVEVSHG